MAIVRGRRVDRTGQVAGGVDEGNDLRRGRFRQGGLAREWLPGAIGGVGREGHRLKVVELLRAALLREGVDETGTHLRHGA